MLRRTCYRGVRNCVRQRWGAAFHTGIDTPHEDDGAEVRQITKLSGASNVGLAALKAVGGVVGQSEALLADAIHSLGDLVSDAVTYWALVWSQRPKTEDQPYGHGKFESIGTAGVSCVLLGTGAGIGLHSFQLLQDAVQGVIELAPPSELAMGAAITSVLVKEALYHITLASGRKHNSKVVMANAVHHRSDALSSVLAVVGVGASWMGFPLLDPLAGLAVAGIILNSGWSIGMDSFSDLTDRSASADTLQKIGDVVAGVSGVDSFHQLRGRHMGPFLHVDLHVVVNPTLSVSAAHHIAERVRWEIRQTRKDVQDVIVHVDVEDDSHPDHTRRSHQAALLRSPAEVEKDVGNVVNEFADVLEMTHLTVYYLPPSPGMLRSSVHVKFEVILKPNVTIEQAARTCLHIKHSVEAGVVDVTSADVHLELVLDTFVDSPVPHMNIGVYRDPWH